MSIVSLYGNFVFILSSNKNTIPMLLFVTVANNNFFIFHLERNNAKTSNSTYLTLSVF